MRRPLSMDLRLRDPDGRPVVGLELRVTPLGYAHAEGVAPTISFIIADLSFGTERNVVTGSGGLVRLIGLPPGPVVLELLSDRFLLPEARKRIQLDSERAASELVIDLLKAP